jgi:hypothetical protein
MPCLRNNLDCDFRRVKSEGDINVDIRGILCLSAAGIVELFADPIVRDANRKFHKRGDE